MGQRLGLDRPGRGAYYAVALAAALLASCARTIPPLAPRALPPIARDSVVRWITELAPPWSRHYELRWRLTTQQGSAAGRAAARIAPPDSMRFDFRAPFGRSGAVVVVGDAIVWSEPRDEFDDLVRAVPLLWASLGIPPRPPAGVSLWGNGLDERRVWRYAMEGDTMEFAVQTGGRRRLMAQVRRGGRVLGAADVMLDATVNLPTAATMIFPGDASRVTFAVERVDTVAALDRDIWVRR